MVNIGAIFILVCKQMSVVGNLSLNSDERSRSKRGW